CLKKAQLVHRDLKPENYLLSSDGVLKLADFGVAKKILKNFTTVCGTPLYMAPEIGVIPYNSKVDIYSAGLILYQMLTGRPPYEELEGVDIQETIKKGLIDFTDKVWQENPDALHLVQNMIHQDPELRFDIDQIEAHVWLKTTAIRKINNISDTLFTKFAGSQENWDDQNTNHSVFPETGFIISSMQQEPAYKPNLPTENENLLSPFLSNRKRIIESTDLSTRKIHNLNIWGKLIRHGSNQVIELKKELSVFGRLDSSDFVFMDPRVSARHCQIRSPIGRGVAILEDL
ncbi:hypothetical protein HK096_000066, partial [Nowakowskiella sp. JEL0078]